MPAPKVYGKWGYSFDPKNVIKDILDRWTPTGPKGGRSGPGTHNGWRDSLLLWLQKSISGVEIKPESGVEDSRGDIALMWGGDSSRVRHYFEIKTHLSSTTDFDRVRGQIERYKTAGGQHVFVILCGEDGIKTDQVEKLRSKFNYTPGVHVFWKHGSSRGVDKLTW